MTRTERSPTSPSDPRGDRLGDGTLLPRIVEPPPGPASRRASHSLRAHEAPGVNTLYRDHDGTSASVVWAAARGATVEDVDGNRYLDFTSGFGVATLGHRHPHVVDAVKRQADRLLHGLGDVAAHPPRVELTRRLARLAPMPDAKVHLAISGADAVEIALKTALLAARPRHRILVFEPAYHGLTLGALAATSRPAFRRPFAGHLHEHVERLPFGCSLDTVDAALARAGRAEGRAGGQAGDPVGGRADGEIDDRFAAIVVEPIVGREGVLLPPPDWLAGLAERAKVHGALFVVDEIFTAFGKTGALWTSADEGAVPDLVCCGKALSGGLPIGAVLGRAELLDAWATDGEALHTATFLGHPLAMASALAVLDLLEDGTVYDRAKALGERIERRLLTWASRFPAIVDIRGRGALWGVEFDTATAAGAFTHQALRRGVLLLAGGPRGTVAQLVPPVTLTHEQLDCALSILEDALGGALSSDRAARSEEALSATSSSAP